MQFDEETWENLEMRAIILTAALRTDLDRNEAELREAEYCNSQGSR